MKIASAENLFSSNLIFRIHGTFYRIIHAHIKNLIDSKILDFKLTKFDFSAKTFSVQTHILTYNVAARLRWFGMFTRSFMSKFMKLYGFD